MYLGLNKIKIICNESHFEIYLCSMQFESYLPIDNPDMLCDSNQL